MLHVEHLKHQYFDDLTAELSQIHADGILRRGKCQEVISVNIWTDFNDLAFKPYHAIITYREELTPVLPASN